MEDEKKALDELLFIKKVIEDSKKIAADNGMGYIVWGFLIMIGQIGGYIRYKYNLDFDYILAWIIIIAIGWTFSYFMYYRRKDKNKVHTFAGKILGGLWFYTGVSMTIAGFVGYYSHSVPGESLAAVLCTILGGAYYLVAIISDLKWMKFFGVFWWLGGILLFFIKTYDLFLVMALLMLFGQIIPGLVLYYKFKRQQGIQQ